MKQVVITFGLLTTAVLVLLWAAQLHQFYYDSFGGLWIVLFAAAFLIAGFFLSRKLFKKEKVVVMQRPLAINYEQLVKAGISKREGEILMLIDEGLSNQQIADKLFISESTVKKHISNLFQKLQVRRRTESVKKAKEVSILY
jgi:DNA-binding CsgD family transcriptional regulator